MVFLSDAYQNREHMTNERSFSTPALEKELEIVLSIMSKEAVLQV
jgi:hypothetical protein